MSVQFEVDPTDSDFAGIGIALGEVMGAMQAMVPHDRHLLEQAWRDERDAAALAGYPQLARVFDSLQALVVAVQESSDD